MTGAEMMGCVARKRREGCRVLRAVKCVWGIRGGCQLLIERGRGGIVLLLRVRVMGEGLMRSWVFGMDAFCGG
jgi:hypothetical protein